MRFDFRYDIVDAMSFPEGAPGLGDHWLPNLDASKIGGRVGGFQDLREQEFQIWRAGVLRTMTDDVMREMKEYGVTEIPKEFEGISARRRGFNNAMKIVIGFAVPAAIAVR